jgi:hypothetical protein
MWRGIVGDSLVGPRVLPLGLEAINVEISSCKICRTYWIDVILAAEHECGTCMMVLRYILAVLCVMFTTTPIMTDGYVEEGPTA